MNDKELKENTIRSAIFVNIIAIMAFAFFIANFTSNNINISEFITISIIILIFTIILNYLIFYEMKFSKYKKESVLLVNNNLSTDKYTEVICTHRYFHPELPSNKKLYAIIDIDGTVSICYEDNEDKDILHPVYSISKESFSTYYRLKND